MRTLQDVGLLLVVAISFASGSPLLGWLGKSDNPSAGNSLIRAFSQSGGASSYDEYRSSTPWATKALQRAIRKAKAVTFSRPVNNNNNNNNNNGITPVNLYKQEEKVLFDPAADLVTDRTHGSDGKPLGRAMPRLQIFQPQEAVEEALSPVAREGARY